MKRYALVWGLAAQQNDETLGSARETTGRRTLTGLDQSERDSLCRSCGAHGVRDFCPSCGEERSDSIPTLTEWAAEVRDEYWMLDGKVIRTLGQLFLRPGFLTAEWIAGRRGAYIRPFRLFLIFLPILVVGNLNFTVRVLVVLASVPILAVASFILIEDSRPRDSIVPHVVLSLHMHSVLLAALLLHIGIYALLGLNIYIDTPFLPGYAVVYIAYLATTTRRLNGISWWVAGIRSVGVMVVHVLLAGVAGALVALIGIMLGTLEPPW